MLITADGCSALTSTLVTLEQPSSAATVGQHPGDLLLVLDAPSAWAENTVRWDVIQMHTGSRSGTRIM